MALVLTALVLPAASAAPGSCNGDTAHPATCDTGKTPTCCAGVDAPILDGALDTLDGGDAERCVEGVACDEGEKPGQCASTGAAQRPSLLTEVMT